MARRQRDVVFVERETTSPLWWLVVGGALGAGVALLFAPDAGSRTRRELARRLARIRSGAEEALGDFREAVSSDDLDDELEDAASDDELEADEEAEEAEVEELVEEAAPSARDELEKRLAAARARRQRERADEDEEPVA